MSEVTKTPEIEMLEKVSGQIEKYVKALEDKISKEDLKPLNEAIEALKNGTADKTAVEEVKKGLQKLSDLFEEMQEDIAANKNRGRAKGIVSPGQAFIDHIINSKLDIQAYQKSRNMGRVQLEVPMLVQKLPATMSTSNVDAVGTDSIPFELADFEFGLTRIARRQPFLMQLANTSPISTMYAQWAEQENPDGAATAVTQGSSKPQVDFDWIEKSQKVEKIAAYIKITKEMLADLPGVRNEIDTELQELVMLKADDDLWDANGTTPNIKGITQFATSYSAPVGLIDIDNNYDVLRAGVAQVVLQKFMPNYIVMHPTDVAALDMIKDGGTGAYVLPPFKAANGQAIAGVPIVENLGVDQGSFLVGDFTKWRVRIREGFNIDMGYDGNDFTKNLITILGEIRLVSYVKGNHTGAFVLGDLQAS